MIQKISNTVTLFDTTATKKIRIADETKALGMLYGLIYTDSKVAAMREYVTNARDTHIKHGVKRPVLIMVSGGEFVVRDFGPGLSTKGMEDSFLACCSTTKDNTNDQYGTFGIGALAALAYSDMFEVISYHNGTKTVYTIRNSEGSPSYSIGEPSACSDDSGLEVRVPIHGDDAKAFLDIAVTLRYLCGMMDETQAIEVMTNDTRYASWDHDCGPECYDTVISKAPGELRAETRMRHVWHKNTRTLWALMQDVRKQYAEVERWLDACDAYDAGAMDVMPKLPDAETFEKLYGNNDSVSLFVPGACVRFRNPYSLCDNRLLLDALGHRSCAYDGNTVIALPAGVAKYTCAAYMAPVGTLTYSPSREGAINDGKLTDLVHRVEKRIARFMNGFVAALAERCRIEDNYPDKPYGIFEHSDQIIYSKLRQELGSFELDGKWCKDAKACVPTDTTGWTRFVARITHKDVCAIRKPNDSGVLPLYVSAGSTMFITGLGNATENEALDRLRKVRHALYDVSVRQTFDIVVLTDAALKVINDLADGYEKWFNFVDIKDLEETQARCNAELAEARKESRKNVARATKADPARIVFKYPDCSGKGMELGDPVSLEYVSQYVQMSACDRGGKAFSSVLVVSKPVVDYTTSSSSKMPDCPAREKGLEPFMRTLLLSCTARLTAGITRVYIVPARYLEEAAAMPNVVTLDKLAEELVDRIQTVITRNNIRLIRPCLPYYVKCLLGLRTGTEASLSREIREHFSAEARDSMPIGLFDEGTRVRGLFDDIASANKLYYKAVELLSRLDVHLPSRHQYNSWLADTIPGEPKPSAKDVDAAVVHAGIYSIPAMYRSDISEAFKAKVAKADAALVKSIRSTMLKYSVPFNIKKVTRDIVKWRRQQEEKQEREREAREAAESDK